MNALPEEIQDTIYKYKHQMEFCKVVQELDTKGLCWWCGARTCCKFEICMNCYIYCEFCEEYHSYFNCQYFLGSDGFTDEDSNDSNIIYLDSDSDDDSNIIYI